MTNDQVRAELATLHGRIDALTTLLTPVERAADGRPLWSVQLDQWLAAQPIGVTGSAAALMPGFLATSPAPPPRAANWTPPIFGRALAPLCEQWLYGRVLRRRADRKGVYVYTVDAVPQPPPTSGT